MGPRCAPLYKVKDEDLFKKAFTSLVKAHHDLYEKAGILHRDVSINNLMVDPSNPSSGILIDLDMAARDKDPDTGMKLELPPLPGGTVPFRAAELCSDDPLPRVLYRHDLESFFFVLIWMLLYRVNEPIDPHFGPWSTGDWRAIRTYKKGFLLSPVTTDLPPDLPLRASWIEPLWRTIGEGYDVKSWHSVHTPGDPFDVETMGGHISYEVYMDILNRSS